LKDKLRQESQILGNILSVEQIFTPGNAIKIIFSQYIGNVKSISAIVKAFQQDGLYITAEAEDTASLLDSGTEIVIQYQDPDGRKYLFSTYKIAQVSQGAPILICARPWEINSSLQYRYFGPKVETPWKVHTASLRCYFRRKVDLPLYYTLEGTDAIFIGRIMDLSVGGLFAVVQPDPRFLLGRKISFQLQLPKTAPFELQGEIVRSQTIENTKLGLAINFLDMPENNRDEIARYLEQNRDEAS
jgi:hypothetical protein